MKKIKNRVKELIEQKEAQLDGFKFSPSNEWYRKKGLGKKRFGKILNNELVPSIEELNVLVAFLGVNSITDLLIIDSPNELL